VQHLDPQLLEALLERLSRELEAHLSSRDSPEEDPAPPFTPWTPRGWPTGARTSFSASVGERRCGGSGGTRGFWPWRGGRGEGGCSCPGVAGRDYAPDPRLGGRAREEARVRAREGWDPEVYRFRGVVEGVFGGMKTRLGGAYLWERKPWTAMVRAFLELIAHGLRVLLSLLPPPPGYKAIY
jgi:hypothetical protein